MYNIVCNIFRFLGFQHICIYFIYNLLFIQQFFYNEDIRVVILISVILISVILISVILLSVILKKCK